MKIVILINIILVLTVICSVTSLKERIKEDSSPIPKPKGDITYMDSIKELFSFSHYLSHILAYDTSSKDTVTNPINKKPLKLLDSAVEILSKKDTINYEGRALVGKSTSMPNILVIVFRGTDNKCNGIEDARIAKTALTTKAFKTFKDAKVHEGFMNVYKSLRDDIRKTVLDMLKADKKIDTILITGHSLGGALANLCAVDMDFYYNKGEGKTVKTDGYYFNLVTFGAPRVGDLKFATYVNSIPKLKRNVRVVYELDLVSQIPFTTDYVHAGTLARFNPAKGDWTLGKFNVDDSPKLEVANSIIDPAGLASYAENLIDLIDCNTTTWEALTKISGKLTKSNLFTVFKTTFKIATDSATSADVQKLIAMGKNHSMYKVDIIPGHMQTLNQLYENLAGANGKNKKKRSLRDQ